jgi:carboxymethylenebutenolidase
MPETKIRAQDGSGEFAAYVAKPKSTPSGGPAGAVVMIQEIFGINGAMRQLSDWVAEMGFVAVAPDLFWRQKPGVDLDPDKGQSEWDQAFALMNGMNQDKAVEDLRAAVESARGLDGANGKVATMGFCWGGSQSFSYAASQPGLDAAVVYYGTSPEAADLAKIKAPVLGLYGEDDARVNATVGPAEAEMKRLKKSYEANTYQGAGHGFLRGQDGREGANLKATQQAWPRTLAFLRQHLK